MPRTKLVVPSCLALATWMLGLAPPRSHAESLLQMNLREMTGRADRIFRGRVLFVAPGTVRVGSRELPALTYRIEVSESFKGRFQEVKGTRIADVRMLRTGAGSTFGGIAVPRLEVGAEYLLLTTRPGRTGLSAPVGLGQGRFRLTGGGNAALAVNDFGNERLFRGMDAPPAGNGRAGGPGRGPLRYAHLANEIRRAVKAQGGQK